MKTNRTSNLVLILMLAAIGFTTPVRISSQITPARTTTARVQLTREDYDRANQMRAGTLLAKLKNGFVVPHWIGQLDEFWYKRDTAKGYEFVRVNAANGHAQPAFNHEKLAQALARSTGNQVSPDKLPFDSFEFTADGSAIHIIVADPKGTKEYDCKLNAAVCAVAASTASHPAPFEITIFDRVPPDTHDPNEGVLISPDNHWGIFTRDNNLWMRDMGTHRDRQLSRDGEPHFGYGTYMGEWQSAEIQRQKAVEAGHHLPPMASSWS
ncbi:MAG TPA: hypothetical protein VG649_24015, partial [Candidatus Angelobacter sp.]|nr:hypothetical protein [Candidatus Angelobacter sp.]